MVGLGSGVADGLGIGVAVGDGDGDGAGVGDGIGAAEACFFQVSFLPCLVQMKFEPFDFLTWFEYAPEHEVAFEKLLAQLRASEEWSYVDREIDIRLIKV